MDFIINNTTLNATEAIKQVLGMLDAKFVINNKVMSGTDTIKLMLDMIDETYQALKNENKELKRHLSQNSRLKATPMEKHSYERILLVNADMDIDDMNLSTRSHSCLKKAGIRTIADILKLDAKSLYGMKGFGSVSAKEVTSKMTEFGFIEWSAKI